MRHQPSVWVLSQVCISAMRGSFARGMSTAARPCGTAIGPSSRLIGALSIAVSVTRTTCTSNRSPIDQPVSS